MYRSTWSAKYHGAVYAITQIHLTGLVSRIVRPTPYLRATFPVNSTDTSSKSPQHKSSEHMDIHVGFP